MTTLSTIATALELLLDSSVDLDDAIDRHFSPTFRQRVDGGSWSERADFTEHMAKLREVMASGTVEVHQELVDGPLYADRHTIEIVMKDGTVVRNEVYVFARHDADGRFSEIQEATLSLSGAANTGGLDSASN